MGRLFFLAAFFVSAFAWAADPAVVPSVDLRLYAGRWYEIGRYPTFFQRNCVRSSAEYGLLGPTEVSVLNTCFKADGGTSSIEGRAYPADPAEPAKLKVDFGFFRKGDYWIVDLDPGYRWSVVSGPGKNSLFILARSAPMSKQTLRRILRRLEAKGFDTGKIIYDRY